MWLPLAVVCIALIFRAAECAKNAPSLTFITSTAQRSRRIAYPKAFAQYALSICPPEDGVESAPLIALLTACASRADDMACARDRRPPTATDVLFAVLSHGRAADVSADGGSTLVRYVRTLVKTCGARPLSEHVSADRGHVAADMLARWADTDAMDALCTALSHAPGRARRRPASWKHDVLVEALYGSDVSTENNPEDLRPPKGLLQIQTLSLGRQPPEGETSGTDDDEQEHGHVSNRYTPLERWMLPGPTIAALIAAGKTQPLLSLLNAGATLGPSDLCVVPARQEHVRAVALAIAPYAMTQYILSVLRVPWLHAEQHGVYAADVSSRKEANAALVDEAVRERQALVSTLDTALRSAGCPVPAQYANVRSVVRALAAGLDGICEDVAARSLPAKHDQPGKADDPQSGPLASVVSIVADTAWGETTSTVYYEALMEAIACDAPITALALVREVGGTDSDAYASAASVACVSNAWRVFRDLVFAVHDSQAKVIVPLSQRVCTQSACLRDAWSTLTPALAAACSRTSCPSSHALGRLAAVRFFGVATVEEVGRADAWLGSPALSRHSRLWHILARVASALPAAGLAALRRLDVVVGGFVFDVAVEIMSDGMHTWAAVHTSAEWTAYIVLQAARLIAGRSAGADAVVPGLHALASAMRPIVPFLETDLVRAAANGHPRVLRRLAAAYIEAGERPELLRALAVAYIETEAKNVPAALRALARAGVKLESLDGPEIVAPRPVPEPVQIPGPGEHSEGAEPRSALIVGLAVALAIGLALVLGIASAAIVTATRMRRGAE